MCVFSPTPSKAKASFARKDFVDKVQQHVCFNMNIMISSFHVDLMFALRYLWLHAAGPFASQLQPVLHRAAEGSLLALCLLHRRGKTASVILP